MAASTFAVIPFAATMSNPSPAPPVPSADHTAVRRLRLLKDATPPCINLDGLTVLSSTVTEHSLQGSNGFFKGSYSWTEDTSFAVSPSTAHGQPQTKPECTSQSHTLAIQTHRRVVEWYKPDLVGRNIIDGSKSTIGMPLLHGKLSASTRAQVKVKPPWGIALLQH